MRCPRRVSRLALENAQGLGHITAGRAPGRHPDRLRATLGIMGGSGNSRAAQHGLRKEPSLLPEFTQRDPAGRVIIAGSRVLIMLPLTQDRTIPHSRLAPLRIPAR